ncbi:MAG: TraG family conjugative transposon ATPase [Puia sp.]|nr:TraG family conjugative transposon ATPase [Puia sp.]
METLFDKVMPIWSVENDAILSKMGDYTVGFEVTKPEIFTMAEENFEVLHQTLVRAIKVLPNHSVLHMQDWYLKRNYQPDPAPPGRSFLNEAADRHFAGRPYLDHRCYLYLTKKSPNRRAVSSATSGLFRKTLFPSETMQASLIRSFLDAVGQFKKIIEDGKFFKLRPLKEEDIWSYAGQTGVLEQYCYLSDPRETAVIRDISFKDGITIGDRHCQLFTLADAEKLPNVCSSGRMFEKYSTDRTKFTIGYSAGLGLLLPCDHIYNQYIIIEDATATMKKLESKRLRLQSLANYSRENAIARDSVNEFLNEAIGEQRIPIKAHFNIVAWTDNPDELKNIRNTVSSAMAQMDASPYHETVGAPQIWWAGIPGNAADLPANECFDTFLDQGVCFLNVEGNYQSVRPEEGIRFSERLYGKPVYVDLFDAPRREGYASNMGMLVCGTSGGGKSMTINHILRTLFDQNAHCLTVDIGGSYKGLCELVGGYYFTFEESKPIQFNPFYIPDGGMLDIEKKESLKALLVALWKQDHENFNRSEYVALSNAIQRYYEHLQQNKDIFPCFNTFYLFLQQVYTLVLLSEKVKEKDFDIDNFLYVLRPYFKGGEFDYLLNATENLELLTQRFIVFELDNIKDNAILFPVCTLIIVELFLSKMRKLKGVRKVLTIDEAWKAIAKSGMAEFLRYAFKTIRKFNGVPIVITQELDDLVSSPIIKDAIINNADIKILMDMRKYVNKFDKLQDVLGMSDKGKTILLSVNKDDREIYIDIGGQFTKVYKNELSTEEYLAYTTDGKERIKVMESAEKYGSMEKGIIALAVDHKKNK